MCGIAFVSTLNNQTKTILPWLLYEIQDRGHDSWGCTDGVNEAKGLGMVMAHLDPPKWAKANNPLLYHTRAATVGAVSVPNSHPFRYNDKHHIIGVHNGSISNWKELNQKYGRSFEVDSMHVFAHMAEDRELSDLELHGAVVWFEGGRINMFKTAAGSLKVARLKTGEVIGASTDAAFEKATAAAGTKIDYIYQELEPCRVYYIQQEGSKKYELYQSKTKVTVQARTWRGQEGWYSRHSGGMDEWYGVSEHRSGHQHALPVSTTPTPITQFQNKQSPHLQKAVTLCAICFGPLGTNVAVCQGCIGDTIKELSTSLYGEA